MKAIRPLLLFRDFTRPGLLAAAAALASGCAKPPPPPPPKPPPVLTLRIMASAQLNPDLRSRPSPVVLRIYELKATSQFDSADFVSLFDKDQATLGAELVTRDEIVLAPSETKSVRRPLQADTRFIGVMAAFRDIERARWRSVAALVADKNNDVAIELNGFTVQATGSAR